MRAPLLSFAAALLLAPALACDTVTPPVLPPPRPAAPPPADPTPEEPLPGVRLPSDTRPTSEAVALSIDPRQPRFSGTADIDIALDHPRTTIWLHGKGLHVTRATARPGSKPSEGAQGWVGPELTATWRQRDESGMASLTLPQPLPAGNARLHIEYDAPFGPKLEGLHTVTEAGVPYAFTQFESIAARYAMPCFDEPGFKIPWDETLTVPADEVAIANTHELDRKQDGASLRFHFAQTLPLPSYLVAFAVGPFDVVPAPPVPANSVRARPLGLRAVTTKGRGREVAYALAHTGEILATLEQYFGIEYPYDKLDILAEPGKGGAMENAGAVVFADQLLLFDEKTASLRQKRGYASVMAHELAHQWVGDLVTAAWWNDIWLNEAFATWVGTKAADLWDPKLDMALQLLGGVQRAMGSDSLVNARAIRQPIASTNDIENAFDGITYQKGAGVLSMFERWVGPDVFQRGLHEYLSQHKLGSGTADDFLDAETKAAGKDIKTPFHTFLDQPGVPFIEVSTDPCHTGAGVQPEVRLHLHQSRFLPVGSAGDAKKTWSTPVCVRYKAGKEVKEACTRLDGPDGEVDLGAVCPDWVFPNANAAGYFRFSLAPADLAKLRTKGLTSLTPRELVAFGNSLRAGFNRAALPMKDAILAAAPLAQSSIREVAAEPMSYNDRAHEWLYADPLRSKVEAYGQSLFRPAYAKLGWEARKGDDSEKVLLRARVIDFLAFTARDPVVRAEAKRRGLLFLGVGKDNAIHREAVDANLAGIALAIAGDDADTGLWESVLARLAKTEDTDLRGRLLGFLVSATRPELLPRVRALAFDPALRAGEVTAGLHTQVDHPETRQVAWQFVKDNFDKLLGVVPKHHGQTQLIAIADQFCDEDAARDIEAFFTPARLALIDGAPRTLASTLESVRLCAALKKVQEPSAREFFGKR